MNQTLIPPYPTTAIVDGDRHIAYAELLRRITLYAREADLPAGGKAIIVGANSTGWIYAFFSIWQSRAIAVPIDAHAPTGDLARVMADCRPDVVWTSRARRADVTRALAQAGLASRVCTTDDGETSPVDPSAPLAHIDAPRDETALILYTSGTTGAPRGVMLSYGNLLSNIEGTLQVGNDKGIDIARLRTLILLPLHHALPLAASLIRPIITGAGVAMCPSMLAGDILETMQRARVGAVMGVPALWSALMRIVRSQIDSRTPTRLLFRLCRRLQWRWLGRLLFRPVHRALGHDLLAFSGGAPLDVETATDCKALGIDMLEGYGMTETSPVISLTPPRALRPGSVGRPLPGTEVAILDGEICVKGPGVMQGYYGQPDETAAVIDSDGWFHTGDLGHLDRHGYLYVDGRKGDLIVLPSGKKVQPNEVEQALRRYGPDVIDDVAVVARRDVLAAIVVVNPAWANGRTPDEQLSALREAVVKPYNLSCPPHKKVVVVTLRTEPLPRNASGKLLRRLLTA